MGNRLLDHIIMELRSTKYLSVSVDSTPDISQVDQLTYDNNASNISGKYNGIVSWLNMWVARNLIQPCPKGSIGPRLGTTGVMVL